MRTSLLPFALLALGAPANAQLTAGEVPNGMNALNLNINISLGTPFTVDSASLELDCDDFMDAWAVLYRGFPAVDAPNSAMLHFVDSDIEVCQDMAPEYQKRPAYHAFGEPLDCTGDFNWQSGAQVFLGDLGGFTATGPAVVDSQYIAYRRGATMGWIELSFDINDDAEIDLQVHRVLSLCDNSTSIPQHGSPGTVTLSPNPNHGEPVNVQSADDLRSIAVSDATGMRIAHYDGTAHTITAPEVAGTYLVRAVHADGRRSVVRLVRH